MKQMKRIAGLMLALVMVLALTVPAFAAGETGSITVENPQQGQEYTAYKIFDVIYKDKAYSYTIAADSEWLPVVNRYDSVSLSQLVTDTSGNEFYVITPTASFSAPAFANVLKAAVEGKTGVALNVADGKATVAGLPLGYYFVTSTSGALCNLTTTDPTASIRDKNEMPFNKVDDDESVEVGQKVNYTITSKVPDTTGFSTYIYEINDTMSDGLTFNKDVQVTIGGTNVTDACTITYDGITNGFKLAIPMLKGTEAKYTAGADIVVTYSAVVNSAAVMQVEENGATLTYSNDPTDAAETTTTLEDIETVYTAEIVIDKHDAANNETKLAGAKFVLINGGTFNPDGTENNTNVNKFYKMVDGKVTWVADQAEATKVTTDNAGKAEFEGLENGTYYLKEIEAPAGYNMLDYQIMVVISHNPDANGKSQVPTVSYYTPVEGNYPDTATGNGTIPVANATGTVLPETGGIGTTIFYVVGGVLVLAAIVLLVTRKRMASEE